MGMNWTVELLRHAIDRATGRGPSRALAWERIDARQLNHVEAAGMLPLLAWAAAERLHRFPPHTRERLLASQWTAQARHCARARVTAEILQASATLGIPVTLLKGMSLAERLYPAAYLRPMADVDLLVAPSHRDRLQNALLARGYVAAFGAQAAAGAPHAEPVRHPADDVWVEVHDRLFPQHSAWQAHPLFTEAQIRAHSRPIRYHGGAAQRFDDTLQLAQTAATWIRDLSRHKPHPSFTAPLLDAALLLHRNEDGLDVDALLDSRDGEIVVSSVDLLISYLAKHSLVDSGRSGLQQRVAAAQRRVGRAERAALHACVDAFVLAGRRLPGLWRTPAIWGALLAPGSAGKKFLALPWHYAFPPRVPS